MKVEAAVKVEPVGEFELKGISRPLAAYNVIAASSSKVWKRNTAAGVSAVAAETDRSKGSWATAQSARPMVAGQEKG
jgi:hypothetical protein